MKASLRLFLPQTRASQARSILGAALLLLATVLVGSPNTAQAADEITAEVLLELGYEEFTVNPDTWSELEKALWTGQYVASKRLSSSNVLLLKRQQSAMGEGAGAFELPEYAQIVGLPPSPGSSDADYKLFIVPVSPEHYERIVQETDPDRVDPLTLSKALDMYANGLMALGYAVDEGVRRSDLAGFGAHPGLMEGGESLCRDLALGETADGTLPPHLTPSQAEAIDRELVSSFRFGGAETGRFSAAMFLFGPACMLKAYSEWLDTYEGDDVEGAALEAMQSMGSELLDTAVSDGYTQEGSTPVATWSMPNLGTTDVSADGTKTTIKKMSVSMDMDNFVIVKQRSEGTIESDSQVRDFYMESEMSDFRYVPDTVLYEPYKKVLRMGGMLGPEERAQMQEAKAKIAEFETQMASMPADQRAMMERMMGSKLEQFRKLADDGSFEIEIITTGFVINPHLSATIKGGFVQLSQSNIVKVVQGHLVTLGYDPGDTTGELTRQTVVAITQFEAASGMPVTGKANIDLIAALEASINARR